ncbi:MAG: hypothetical protein ACOZCL_18020 [Bacillota bacterium]
MILYHRTVLKIAQSILDIGFIDSTELYLTTEEFTGVWFSNISLDINEGADGDTLLQIKFNFTEEEIDQYEWKEGEKPYREFLMPAAFANNRMISIRTVEDEDEELEQSI